MKKTSDFVFVIDTDSYAGNFERDLCAHITGQTGECGVGEEYADEFIKEHSDWAEKFANIVVSRSDGEGCKRPVEIWPTPGRFNDGMGGYYGPNDAPEEVAAQYALCAHAYFNPLIEKAKAAFTKGFAEHEGEVRGLEAEMERLITIGPGKYPVAESVGIFFKKRPDQEMIDFMKNRAASFNIMMKKLEPSWSLKKPIQILGFRMISTVCKEFEEAI